jgi:hypothetical protein
MSAHLITRQWYLHCVNFFLNPSNSTNAPCKSDKLIFISHDELGEGEGAAVGLDREWLLPFQNCLGAIIYQDQHGSSSQFRLRPDYTIVYRGAIVLKVESKGAEGDMGSSSC